MNPGYLTFVSVLCFSILALSGWNRELCGDMRARTIAALLFGWAASLLITWELQAGTVLSGGALFALLLTAAAAGRAGGGKAFVRTLTVAALILLVHASVLRMHSLGLSFFAWPAADLAAGAAAVAALFLRKPAAQFAALIWGLMAGDVLAQAASGSAPLVIGGASIWDGFWPAFLLARAVSSALEWIGAGARRWRPRMK